MSHWLWSIVVFLSASISLIDGAPLLTGMSGNYQGISGSDAISFVPYLYPRLNNLSSTYEYTLLVPPLPTLPTSNPRFNLQTTAPNGVFVVIGYIVNGARLILNRGGGGFEEKEYNADEFDTTIDTFREANANANGNNQWIGLEINRFSSKTDIFAQVYDPTLGTRNIYWIHATVAPAESNVELGVAMEFNFKCDDPYYNSSNFIAPLDSELRNYLGSLAGVTTINVQSADCSSDSPAARFSVKSSGSKEAKQSCYDVYVELLKNIQNPTGTSAPVYLRTANAVAVASVTIIPIPPPQPSSANKTLAIVVGVCGAVAAIIMAAIFVYFHKKKQSGQWNADKENVSLAGGKDVETAA